MSEIFDLNPSDLKKYPKLELIAEKMQQLKKKQFKYSDDFIDGFSDPNFRGIPIWVIGSVILVIIFNVFALVFILIFFWWRPRRIRRSVPPQDATADKWFEYAEKNLKYNAHKEIRIGYEKALELKSNHSLALLRYGQYEASLAIQYKPTLTGDPPGLPSNFDPEKAYKRLVQGINFIGNKNSIFHPYYPDKIEPIFSIAGILAFDLKKFEEAKNWLIVSFTHREMETQQDGFLKALELRLALIISLIQMNEISIAIDQLNLTLKLSKYFKKHVIEAQGWELLGESFRLISNKKDAEFCFIKAVSIDSRRWISAQRMYSFCKKDKRTDEAEYYKNIFKRVHQKVKPF